MRQDKSVIFLVGARASGKSTVGHLLSRALGFAFADTDVLTQTAAGRSVEAIIADEGWPGFRARESQALHDAARPRSVVATGGGMILAPENRLFMRERGIVFYLHAEAAQLVRRLEKNPQNSLRPSLTGKGLIQEMEEILEQRLPLYRAVAHHEVDASLPSKAVARAVTTLLAGSTP